MKNDKKPFYVKGVFNKRNGQCNISLPKKKLPTNIKNKIKDKFLRGEEIGIYFEEF